MLFSSFLIVQYRRLDGTDSNESRSDVTTSVPIQSHTRQRRCTPWSILGILLIVSVFLNVALTLVIFNFLSRGGGEICGQLVYSPAQDAVSHQVVTFRSGFGNDVSIYQGDPSPEVDQAWEGLYDDWGIFRMSRNDAARLPNKTYPWPGDSGYYIGELGVAHQLHCLNRLRQGIFAEYYRGVLDPEVFESGGTLAKEHLSHCVESIRQALICASDISVVVWTWDDRSHKAAANGNSVHSCRNFESIRNWAIQHRPVVRFNGSIYIKDGTTV